VVRRWRKATSIWEGELGEQADSFDRNEVEGCVYKIFHLWIGNQIIFASFCFSVVVNT